MDIFKNKYCDSWGLRGDPELWDALERRFEHIKDPKDERGFNKLLEREYNALLELGEKRSEDMVWFKDFSQHGMSGGAVTLQWWQEAGLPELRRLYVESLRI